MTGFRYIHLSSIEDVLAEIKDCESKHVQQAVFSTFHNGMTQICFTEKVIRSTILARSGP